MFRRLSGSQLMFAGVTEHAVLLPLWLSGTLCLILRRWRPGSGARAAGPQRLEAPGSLGLGTRGNRLEIIPMQRPQTTCGRGFRQHVKNLRTKGEGQVKGG